MALSEFEQARVERLMRAYLERHRPPPHLRGRVDLGYRLEGQTLDLFEIRADWQDPERKLEMPAARARYIKSRRRWSWWRLTPTAASSAESRAQSSPCRRRMSASRPAAACSIMSSTRSKPWRPP